ncbi:MAG TPA: hypothetical protein V6D20_12090 [Candidatus Obscuribacterales bacterium]
MNPLTHPQNDQRGYSSHHGTGIEVNRCSDLWKGELRSPAKLITTSKAIAHTINHPIKSDRPQNPLPHQERSQNPSPHQERSPTKATTTSRAIDHTTSHHIKSDRHDLRTTLYLSQVNAPMIDTAPQSASLAGHAQTDSDRRPVG